MQEIQQFKDIISFWPTAADFGRDIGVGDISGRAMRQRNSIPSKYWNAVIKAAESRGILNITHEILAKLAAHPAKPNGKRKNGHG